MEDEIINPVITSEYRFIKLVDYGIRFCLGYIAVLTFIIIFFQFFLLLVNIGLIP